VRVGDYLRLLGVESRSHGIVGSIPTALVDGGRVAVGEVAARRALGWAEYLRSHAGRVYAAGEIMAENGARLIVERRDSLRASERMAHDRPKRTDKTDKTYI
jgi:hypothetical protein